MELRIPGGLAACCRKTPERSAWLTRLPGMVRTLEERWSLSRDGALGGEEATCSYVSAVLGENGVPAVLKIGMPHWEGEQEILGLRFWCGDPTVRLLAADDDLGAMLLERSKPGTTLRGLAESDQDVVISRLLRRLWRTPASPHSFRSLASLTEHWTNETLTQVDHWPDRGLVGDGLHLFEELPRTTTTRECLLATDLHAGNVLRAEREPWLVIDPKPFLGDPAYDATQHLFNCCARLQADPDRTIRSFADLLGVEHERVRLWTFARAAAEPRDDWKNSDRMAIARAIAP
jgi:streptomycin 6-kinase